MDLPYPFQQLAQQPSQPPSEHKLSKKQVKKAAKQEAYLAIKKIKKDHEKAKKKQIKLKLREEKQRNQDKKEEEPYIEKMAKKRDIVKERVKEGVRVVIDLSYWPLMTDKEQKSLIRQLSYCQNTVKNSTNPPNITLSSCTPQIQHSLISQFSAQHWAIIMDPQFFTALPGKLVYLTADAEQQIEELSHDHVYIVGGLVDHNRYKLASFNLATEHKVGMARLPLEKVVKLRSSCHLAVNHVIDILTRKAEGGDWQQACKVIPQRKLQ